MDKRIAMTAVLAIVLVTAGCSSGGPTIEDGANNPIFDNPESSGGAQTSSVGGPGDITMTEEERLQQELRERGLDNIIVYFAFDQSDIQPEFNEMLAAHAEFLTSRPGARVRLEGHADETGSREYNIGLGERRAQAVRRILMLRGAPASQLTTVSYGEERPAALGSDDEAYGLNRRVELVYE